MKTINFKINHTYSDNTIFRNLENLHISGSVKGGEHTIENDKYKFVMLESGAWRGNNSYFYKLTEIK